MGVYKYIIILFFIMSCRTVANFSNGSQTLIERDELKFIKAFIKGKKVCLLVDTGAKTTILDKNFCDDIGIKYNLTTESITGLGGKIELYRTRQFEFKILNNSILYRANVTNLTHMIDVFKTYNIEVHGILGSDFLKENKCIINYKTNTLECNNN